MRRSNAIILLALCMVVILPVIRAQDEGVGTRGPFIVTRPDKSRTPPATGKGKKVSSVKKPAPSSHRLGLGLTIFQEIGGSPVRVNSSTKFRSGDRVRLMVEANTNGYLYIFHTENGQSPTMIFPDARLHGDNAIFAHVPYEVPSRSQSAPNDWFVFDETPATERIYLIVARQPLPGVPTGARLAAHCKANPDSCAWQPTAGQWVEIIGQETPPSMVAQARGGSSSNDEGKAETEEETEAVKRGFGLPKNAPAPSIIKLSASEKASRIVTVVNLEHR